MSAYTKLVLILVGLWLTVFTFGLDQPGRDGIPAIFYCTYMFFPTLGAVILWGIIKLIKTSPRLL